jgi:hypothetical protein
MEAVLWDTLASWAISLMLAIFDHLADLLLKAANTFC